MAFDTDVNAARTGSPTLRLEWLLLLSFPNGGSTAFAKTLLSSHETVALTPNAEGQWLVPAMSARRRRWRPDARLDYGAIRRSWVDTARQATAARGPFSDAALVVEKSPPNMCRYRAIRAMLEGMRTHTVVMTRDPFATCASWHLRYGPDGVTRDWGWPDRRPTDEGSYFRALGAIWLQRARHLEAARAEACAWIRYEDAAERPAAVIGELADKVPQLRTVDPEASVQVKDYPAQAFQNMNDAQLRKLSPQNLRAISAGLEKDPDLVARFGYDLAPPEISRRASQEVSARPFRSLSTAAILYRTFSRQVNSSLRRAQDRLRPSRVT